MNDSFNSLARRAQDLLVYQRKLTYERHHELLNKRAWALIEDVSQSGWTLVEDELPPFDRPYEIVTWDVKDKQWRGPQQIPKGRIFDPGMRSTMVNANAYWRELQPYPPPPRSQDDD